MLRRLALLTLLAVCACRSRTTGNQGNLEFSYPTDDDPFDFNKPVGVGARLKVTVAKAGTHGAVTLEKASSSAATVLDVESFQGNQLVLIGKGAGSAVISVTAKSESTSLDDDVNMLARVPEVLKLGHTCVVGTEGRYLVGKNVFMPFELEMKNKQSVIGYGLYPVSISPDAGMTLDTASTDQTFLHLTTASTAQTVTLSSTIDTTAATFVLVTAGDVDGGEFYSAPLPTLVNTTAVYHVVPTVAAKRVCQPDLTTTVSTSTPAICSVAMVDGADNDPKGRYGWIAVTGKALGYCDMTLGYPQANAGAGASIPLRVTVAQVQFPDGGTADAGSTDGG